MAQPNVVREPSMDEILASIRRIIESNDPVTSPGVATAFAEPEGFAGLPANDDVEEVTLTVDEHFADRESDYSAGAPQASVLRPVAEVEERSASEIAREMRQPAANAQPVPQRSLSLADVAARVRAVSERGVMAREHTAPQHSVVETQRVIVEAPAPVASIQQVDRAEPVDVKSIAVEPVAPVSVELPPEARAVSQEIKQEPLPEAPRLEAAALLSASTGEQVARSFQDLAFAIDNAERRSLDEIAEEMLRPMLQEWLDDNLPTLVERLVREEIERVARGPRR